MNNMEGQQKAMKEKLATIQLSAEAGDGLVKVSADGNRTLTEVIIAPELLASDRKEELEDLLLVAINEALQLAADKEAETAQAMMQDLLPPGLGNLSGLLG